MGPMKKHRTKISEQPVSWLPVDSRLVLPLFSFGHVHGMAKIFLTIEMILAVAVVVGSLAMTLLRLFY